jgi:hypothetical protein
VLSGHVSERVVLGGKGPRQEAVDCVVEMAADDFCEDVGEIGFPVDARKPEGLDEQGKDFSATVGAREERILAIERDGTD